jgi:hypothetical protein
MLSQLRGPDEREDGDTTVTDRHPRTTNKLGGEAVRGTSDELESAARLRELSRVLASAQSGNEHWHRVVTQRSSTLSRLLHLDHLYRQILDVPGVICEFGVHWGATLATLLNLRAIHEPFNVSRTIVGFDTFEGFVSVSEEDRPGWDPGDFASMADFDSVLAEILTLHESFAPNPEVRKHEIVKGDVLETLEPWLGANPHAIIAMAILDLDLYEPTRHVLRQILPRCTQGSVLVFDELNCPEFPGETRAVMEELGFGRLRLRRSRFATYPSWAVIGDS